MLKVIEVAEVRGEGLPKLLGCNVTLFCFNYIYFRSSILKHESWLNLCTNYVLK